MSNRLRVSGVIRLRFFLTLAIIAYSIYSTLLAYGQSAGPASIEPLSEPLSEPGIAQIAQEVEQEIERKLDQALAEQQPDYEARLRLVAEAEAYYSRAPDAAQSIKLKTRLVEGIANMRLGRFELSQGQLASLCPSIDKASYPELLFRCKSMQAALEFIQGDRAASLTSYEQLLSQNLTGVSAGLLARASLNYANVLSENGRSAEAADIYEQQMVLALSTADDALAMFAGNNLIVILITQGDHLAAQETLNQLSEVRQRNPDSIVQGSLRLHELELMRVAGQRESAILGLREFIRLRLDPTPVMMGSAHKLLADALLETDQLDEALEQVDIAIGMLSPQVNEVTEARLTRARILLEMQSYAAVLEELAKIDVAGEGVPARRVKASRLKLQALLQQSGETEKLDTLLDLLKADEQRDRLASTTRSEYFEARLTAARRALALQQAQALTVAAVEKNQLDKKRRNQSVFLLGLAALVVCLIVYLLVNRRAERRLLIEKETQNEELGALVAAKTRELTTNLRAQADMAKALERKNRAEAIGLLAGNVAHDFNNLLQVIASANETLANPASSAADKSAVLDISSSSLAHASRVIRQLLAYSRQQDLVSHPVRFGDYLQNTQALLLSAAGAENELVIEDSSNNAAVLVDPAQLTTSLLNLISNASDAMQGGGTVTLSAEVRALDGEQANLWNDIHPGKFLVLSVRDTGIGMSPEQVARAPEPFFTTKSVQLGTGLGLSSVFGFVKQSGGDIEVISEPGEGTLVRILLPLTHQLQAFHTDKDTASRFDLAGKRVLLVEDNESVARVLMSVLRQIGLDSTHSLSGQEAQALLLTDSNFDYVLSDVRMPGKLNGPALARWIQREYPFIKVLLMSGFNELGTEDTDLPLISKPFNIEQLKRFLSAQNQPA